MHVLALLALAPGHTPADLGPYTVAENRAVWELYARGTVRAMHAAQRPGGPPGAALDLEVVDVDEARAAVHALPMVAAGVLAVDLVALAPFRPLEALFAPGAREA